MILKVIPAARVEAFKLRHYYRSRDSKQTTTPVFEADELTRMGVDYTNVNRNNMKPNFNLPACWTARDDLRPTAKL
jgi:hypothetical protein